MINERKITFLMILILFVSCVALFFIMAWANANDKIVSYEKQIATYEQEIESYKQQHIDESFMFKLASYYGGTVEQRAYNMQVILNLTEDGSSIQEVVLYQLYEIEGLNAFEFEEIIFTEEENIKALNLVYLYQTNNTNNAKNFIKW